MLQSKGHQKCCFCAADCTATLRKHCSGSLSQRGHKGELLEKGPRQGGHPHTVALLMFGKPTPEQPFANCPCAAPRTIRLQGTLGYVPASTGCPTLPVLWYTWVQRCAPRSGRSARTTRSLPSISSELMSRYACTCARRRCVATCSHSDKSASIEPTWALPSEEAHSASLNSRVMRGVGYQPCTTFVSVILRRGCVCISKGVTASTSARPARRVPT